jgi:pimeloyl-ACP methyl ester carboxylesterase
MHETTPMVATRQGTGPALVLLHGLGSSRAVWDPITPALAQCFDVIALDLPGFGDSPPLAPGDEPTPARLAGAVAETLDSLAVATPHVVGNSLGGWVALELTAVMPVASLTLLSPAGLWRGGVPRYCRWSLAGSRALARHLPRVLGRLVGTRLGRQLVLGQVCGRPARMSATAARRAVADLGACPGFPATFRATLPRRYVGPLDPQVPVTVAFGSRDRILLRRQSRRLDALPAARSLVTVPGVGHVPIADDPAAVIDLVRRSAVASQVLDG